MQINCPVCRTLASKPFLDLRYPEFGYCGAFSLRECQECLLLFNSPRLDDEALSQLYDGNYYFFNRADRSEIRRIVPMYARSVALVAPEFEPRGKPRRVLDVGSARGYFPAILRRLGWDAHGVEISSAAATYARERFGLETIFNGTIEQYAASPGALRFPLVTAIDVIEHVPSPPAFVDALSKVVERDGILIVDTPNAASKNIAAQGSEWKGFNPFHIFIFNTENLRRLLEDHGFRVERSFSYGNVTSRLPGWRTAAVRVAKSLGVMGPLARAYFRLQGLSPGSGDIEPHLSAAARTIQSPDFEAIDADSAFAQRGAGDNIVVIARKI